MASTLMKFDNEEDQINFNSIFELSKDNSEKLKLLIANSLKFTKFNETEVRYKIFCYKN